MKYSIISKLFLIVCISIITILDVDAQQNSSKKDVDEWINSKQWAKNLSLELHPSVNKDSFYIAYHRNPKLWDAAFEFLAKNNLDTMKPGKYPIIGEEVFANITEAPSHNKDSVKWESHSKYVDLQYIIKGKELIGIADTAKATIVKPYTPDVINYTAEGKYYVGERGKFFLFFPNDAHRPTIKINGYDIVKKIVIKIQTAKAE